MRAVLCVAMVAALVLFVGGCEETHDSITNKAVGKMEEFAKILEGVKDEASAKAAVSKLEALGEEMKKLKEQADKMGKPDADAEKKLKEKYEERMKTAMGKVMKESMRIGTDPKLGQHIQDAMKNLKM